MSSDIFDLPSAVAQDDLERVKAILSAVEYGRDAANLVDHCGKPIAIQARSVEMARLFLDSGTNLDNIGRAWSPGFGVNPEIAPEVGRFYAEHGAKLSPNAAAGLGLVDHLEALSEEIPDLANAPGGDGCTPLHFARTKETVEWLLAHGAEIDARDEDHDSTPAQWLIQGDPEVVKHLIKRGAGVDIFLAAALGDRAMAESLIAKDRSCLSCWIGRTPYPPIGHNGRGGTIYQWTLGFNSFPSQIAAKRGHHELAKYLVEQSDVQTQFLVACVTADRNSAMSLLASHPHVVANLPDLERSLLARYCWETNVNLEAVRLMLDCGFPKEFPETSHGYSPLHNAAWGGYGDLVDLLLERGHSVVLRDPTYNGTPFDFSMHCCLKDGRHPEGEYARVAASLLKAGSPWDQSIYPTGREELDRVLEQYRTTTA